MSTQYQAAYDASTAATNKFLAIQKAYLAGEIKDAQFLAARKVHDAAKAAFDLSYVAEEERAEQESAAAEQAASETPANSQLALF